MTLSPPEDAMGQAWSDVGDKIRKLHEANFDLPRFEWGSGESIRSPDPLNPEDLDIPFKQVEPREPQRRMVVALAQSLRLEEGFSSLSIKEEIASKHSYNTHVERIAVAYGSGDRGELMDTVDSIWDDLLDLRAEVAEVRGDEYVRTIVPFNHQLLERSVQKAPAELLGAKLPRGGDEEDGPSLKSLGLNYHKIASVSINRPTKNRSRTSSSTPTVRTTAKMAASLDVHPALLLFDDDLIQNLEYLVRHPKFIEEKIRDGESVAEEIGAEEKRQQLLSGKEDNVKPTGRFRASARSDGEKAFVQCARQIAEAAGIETTSGVVATTIGLVTGVSQAVVLGLLFDRLGIGLPEPLRLSDLAEAKGFDKPS